jgi:hypothetical protein
LCVGYPSTPGTKIPKINKCYDEQYDINQIMKETNVYDEEIKLFYKKLIDKEIGWKEMVVKNSNKLLPNDSETYIKKIFDIN